MTTDCGLWVVPLNPPAPEPPEELLDFRRQLVHLDREPLAAPSLTILTLTDTTAALTRSISGANDGMGWPLRSAVVTAAAWATWERKGAFAECARDEQRSDRDRGEDRLAVQTGVCEAGVKHGGLQIAE